MRSISSIQRTTDEHPQLQVLQRLPMPSCLPFQPYHISEFLSSSTNGENGLNYNFRSSRPSTYSPLRFSAKAVMFYHNSSSLKIFLGCCSVEVSVEVPSFMEVPSSAGCVFVSPSSSSISFQGLLGVWSVLLRYFVRVALHVGQSASGFEQARTLVISHPSPAVKFGVVEPV